MNNSAEHLNKMRPTVLSTDRRAKELEAKLKRVTGRDWVVICVPKGQKGEGGFRLSRPDGKALDGYDYRDLSHLYAKKLGLAKIVEWPNARSFYFFPDELHLALHI